MPTIFFKTSALKLREGDQRHFIIYSFDFYFDFQKVKTESDPSTFKSHWDLTIWVKFWPKERQESHFNIEGVPGSVEIGLTSYIML